VLVLIQLFAFIPFGQIEKEVKGKMGDEQ